MNLEQDYVRLSLQQIMVMRYLKSILDIKPI
jgi:hypothetical protein